MFLAQDIRYTIEWESVNSILVLTSNLSIRTAAHVVHPVGFEKGV